MKKIILTVVTCVFVAIVAQAQSPRVEVALTRTATPTKAADVAQDKTSKKQGGTLQKKVTQQVAKATQKAATKTATKTATPKKTVSAKAPKGTFCQYVKATILGGKFPGETDEAYHNRLVAQSHPASLPFK